MQEQVTLTYFSNPVAERYRKDVDDVAELMLQHQEVLELYKEYKEKLDSIKNGFFEFCDQHNASVKDTLEADAAALLEDESNRKSVQKKVAKKAAKRLNSINKSAVMLDVIDEFNKSGNVVGSDGFVDFATLKKSFIKHAKKRFDAVVKMQGYLYFDVPAFGVGDSIITLDDIDGRPLIGGDGSPLKSNRNYVNVASVEQRLRSAYEDMTLEDEAADSRTTRTASAGGVVTKQIRRGRKKASVTVDDLLDAKAAAGGSPTRRR
jgi:hypothetical protein